MENLKDGMPIKIECEAQSVGSKIWLGGQELRMVKSITLEVGTDRPATLTIKFVAPSIKLDGEVGEIEGRLIKACKGDDITTIGQTERSPHREYATEDERHPD